MTTTTRHCMYCGKDKPLREFAIHRYWYMKSQCAECRNRLMSRPTAAGNKTHRRPEADPSVQQSESRSATDCQRDGDGEALRTSFRDLKVVRNPNPPKGPMPWEEDVEW